MSWQRIASLEDCPPGRCLEALVGERIIALFNVDGELHALDGVCPHQGGPLGRGELNGCVVTCPWHGWQFDVKTGRHQLSASIVQPHFPVKTESGGIWVEIKDAES
jgi:nitrite reductase (NADH) small subunit